MKILIAPDKFKGSLSAEKVCEALAEGIRMVLPHASIVSHPMADGGDGSLDILKKYIELTPVACLSYDPLMRPIKTEYYVNDDTAYIELASCSGYVLLSTEERNPMWTTSFGTGVLIKHAIEITKANKIYLFIGGSATNDAGIGIANALGYKFYDSDYHELKPIGANLPKIVKIDQSNYLKMQSSFSIFAICDVQNPFYGSQGAAYMYARQKGANDEEIKLLDTGLKNISEVIEKDLMVSIANIPGSGAAGGIGGGMMAFSNAKHISGSQFMVNQTRLEDEIKDVQLIISGEGKLDDQSLYGKLPSAMSILARDNHIPFACVCGIDEMSQEAKKKLNIIDTVALVDIAPNIQNAITQPEKYLKMAAEKLIRNFISRN
ncbi:MAG: glycerate kinase [Lewinellaceae bacterium]|nr:glycerate kinase [Lewinellaceae bacterium]